MRITSTFWEINRVCNSGNESGFYDLDHPREYVPKSIEVQRAYMKEREFYVAFLEKLKN